MASSNTEQSRLNMPKQHKRWQRTHQMPGKPQPTCKYDELEISAVFLQQILKHKRKTFQINLAGLWSIELILEFDQIPVT